MTLRKAALCCLLTLALTACKSETDTALQLSNAFAYAPFANTPGVAYLTLSNPGANEILVDRFTSNCFAQVELHSSVIDNGVSRMRAIDTLRVAALSSLTLQPGGLHLMLLRANEGVAAGSQCTLTIHNAEAEIDSIDIVLLDRATYRPAEPVK